MSPARRIRRLQTEINREQTASPGAAFVQREIHRPPAADLSVNARGSPAH